MTQVYRCCLRIFILFGVVCSVASAQEEWMPDPNLRQTVREVLELPDEILLTQAAMRRLTRLDAYQREIIDLTGIEHATHLTWLSFAENQVRDLSPLGALSSYVVSQCYSDT